MAHKEREKELYPTTVPFREVEIEKNKRFFMNTTAIENAYKVICFFLHLDLIELPKIYKNSYV